MIQDTQGQSRRPTCRPTCMYVHCTMYMYFYVSCLSRSPFDVFGYLTHIRKEQRYRRRYDEESL